jgi:hypothetical protein
MAVSRREHATSDSAIARYVRQSIELRDPAGRRLPIAWDSVRREGDITLLSFHTTSAGGVRGVTVRQVMQMELYDDQVNVLQARFAGRSVSLLFLPGDGPKELQ